MSSSPLRSRIAALRAEAAALGEQLAAQGAGMGPEELFEVAGDLQGVANAVEGAQLVAIAHAGAHEHRLTGRGMVQVHHGLGFVDEMTVAEVSLATGLGQWAAGRKVGHAADLAGRFPRLLTTVIAGELAVVNAAKVADACEGLDQAACAAVEAVMLDRLPGLDPARITTVARRVATRIAADQVAAAHRKNRKDRAVQVTPGPDGTTDWWARLPTARSAQAWAAITTLAQEYTTKDTELTLDQARADAFLDLLLTNVTTSAHVTLGIPVLTGQDGHRARHDAEAELRTAEDTTAAGADTTAAGTTLSTACGSDSADRPHPEHVGAHPEHVGADGERHGATAVLADPRPLIATGGQGLGTGFSLSAALVSGCEIPGLGFIDAETIETLLTVVPLDVGRALLDARTGTLLETVSTTYRPPKAITDFVTTRDGTCRMWGCTRPARRCDLDHARPWPTGPTTPTNLGGLCRRHHRLKQRRRWTYTLAPDGTATWTSPRGKRRVTLPDHHAFPPPPATPAPTPTPAPATPEPVPPPPF